MRSKSPELMSEIKKYIEDYYLQNRQSPSTTKIAEAVGIARGTAYKYLVEMAEKNMIEYDGQEIRTNVTRKYSGEQTQTPIVGSIPCGSPQYEEENIEEYVSLPTAIFGKGDFFILRASGQSMIEAGIDDGDLVVVKKQVEAKEGDIVVALVDNQNTLKRYFRDDENKKIILHPENKKMKDIIVDECCIQGVSRAELEEISEGLITAYANKFSNRVIQSIDIEHFITEFLMLRIEYASFAEDDAGRIGFLADGATPLLIHQDGKIIPFVFPKDTIVLDKFLLAEKEQGRRRFTMAHEASHHILSKMYAMPSEGRFHAEYDSERSYSKEELAQMFASVEWQADTMGASLLMPRRIIENALAKYNQSNPIKVYGDNTITSKDKAVIRRMAAYIGVSYTALVIRLRDMGLFEYHNILEYISNELNLGGVSQ